MRFGITVCKEIFLAKATNYVYTPYACISENQPLLSISEHDFKPLFDGMCQLYTVCVFSMHWVTALMYPPH